MTIKNVKLEVKINKHNVTEDVSKYLMSLTYTDYEKGQSDELSLELKDNDKLFQNDWRPRKGDKISAKIGYNNLPLLNCGTFTIDEVEYGKSSDGDVFLIKALAASINQKVREKNNKSYKDKTLVEIAKHIGTKHGYKVAGASGFLKIPYVAQMNESDLAFLSRIASEYGYIFKLTNNIITFTPVENLENSKTVNTYTISDIEEIRIKDSGVGTYNKCSVQYLNNKGKTVTYTAKSEALSTNKETLKLSGRCSSKEEAVRKAKAGLKQSTKSLSGSINFKQGQTKAIAGVNIELDLGNSFSGKYHIKQSTHTVNRDGYTTSVEIEGK